MTKEFNVSHPACKVFAFGCQRFNDRRLIGPAHDECIKRLPFRSKSDIGGSQFFALVLVELVVTAGYLRTRAGTVDLPGSGSVDGCTVSSHPSGDLVQNLEFLSVEHAVVWQG